MRRSSFRPLLSHGLLTGLFCVAVAAPASAQSPIPVTGQDARRGEDSTTITPDSAKKIATALATSLRALDSSRALAEARNAAFLAAQRRLDSLTAAAGSQAEMARVRAERDSLAAAAMIAREHASRDSTARAADSLARELRAKAGYVQRDTTCDGYRARQILPVRQTRESMCFWFQQRGLSALNVANLSGGGDQASAYVEVLSYTMGWLHGSVAGVVATSKDSSGRKTDLQRLVAGGGSTVFALALPLTNFADHDNSYYSSVILSPRVGFDLPALGATRSGSNSNYDLGGDLIFKARSYEDNIGFVLGVRAAQVIGETSNNRRLALSDNRQFHYATYALGITLQKAYQITITRPFWGPGSLRELGTQVTVTAIRTESRK